MKTITLKTDDGFFERINSLAKSLHLTKSELIRRSVREYENYIKRENLKKQIQEASFNVRTSNAELMTDFDTTIDDGLKDV